MTQAAKRLVSLAAEHDAFIEAKIRSGSYGSASEVVGAGLQALQDQDAALESWLREEVAPVFDAMKAEPARGIPVTTAFDRIRARHAERIKTGT
jgi:antitoxin ParD1/3/4